MKLPILLAATFVGLLGACSDSKKPQPLPAETQYWQYWFKEYPSQENGLSCSLVMTESAGEAKLSLVLKNISDRPIEIPRQVASWTRRNPGFSQICLSPENFSSERPDSSSILKSLIVIQPGDSFSFPVDVEADRKGLPVEVGFFIREAFGQKFGVWHGAITASWNLVRE